MTTGYYRSNTDTVGAGEEMELCRWDRSQDCELTRQHEDWGVWIEGIAAQAPATGAEFARFRITWSALSGKHVVLLDAWPGMKVSLNGAQLAVVEAVNNTTADLRFTAGIVRSTSVGQSHPRLTDAAGAADAGAPATFAVPQWAKFVVMSTDGRGTALFIEQLDGAAAVIDSVNQLATERIEVPLLATCANVRAEPTVAGLVDVEPMWIMAL